MTDLKMIFITMNNEKQGESFSELFMFVSTFLCLNLEFIGWSKSLAIAAAFTNPRTRCSLKEKCFSIGTQFQVTYLRLERRCY